MVRVVRLERTVSWSQTRRDTNFAIPGYSLSCHDTTARGKNKVFSVCGHLCGQSRFCAAFGKRGKSSKRRCCKALRRFTMPRPGYRHGTPKPMSELSARGLAPSLALSGTPAVPLWNSIGLFISGTAFGFWDLCGIEFCILKVLPTGFTSNSGCFLPQRAAQKLRRINKEINPTTKKQQADLDDSQPAERRCLFDVLSFSSNACSFTRECNADFYN